jgi:glucose/arabinose dehydrogenase
MKLSTRNVALSIALVAAIGRNTRAASNDPDTGDSARGRVIFLQSCAVCHSAGLEKQAVSGQGPLLAGVVGRKAASLPNFGYSKALQASGLTWDAATLDQFLTGPGALVPGTTMVISLPSRADRADLIAFLRTLRPVAASSIEAQSAHPASPGDWENDAPGVIHQTVVADLPPPFATKSAGNSPHTVDRPAGAMLSVPKGFRIEQLASGLEGPRLMRTAPNGDLFIACTNRGDIRVIRLSAAGDGIVESSVFARGLKGPFGLAFYPLTGEPQWLYVGEQNAVVRFAYHGGDLKAAGPAETIVGRLAESTGGHSTRDLAFSPDGKRLFISVGSGSNVAEGMRTKSPDEVAAWESAHAFGAAWGYEANRANILVTTPDGSAGLKILATGIRNAVGIAIQPSTGVLWCSTNERDGLGDDLVPDYVTRVREGGYYGWPWYYMGNHEDPRHAGERPDLAGKAITPDVPEQSHSASLQMTFYPTDLSGPGAFPDEYRGDAFVALHGSWNRSGRTGSKVVRILLRDGVPTGKYQDFVTGFVIDDGHVWGRPVGVTVAHDGSLLFTEDANSTLWRVSRSGD